jgi:hypothetical protein
MAICLASIHKVLTSVLCAFETLLLSSSSVSCDLQLSCSLGVVGPGLSATTGCGFFCFAASSATSGL